MDLHIFSLLLAFLSIATFLCTVLWFSLVSVFPGFQKMEKKYLSYTAYIKIVGFLAIFSTVSVLIYQLYYELAVCELCWWQRIFMFPIDIIAIVSLMTGMQKNHITIGILSLFGTFFAGYHYWYHFRGWVMDEIISLPCSVGGLLPACTDNNGILAFGFLTIPGMALLIFLSLLMISWRMGKKTLTYS